MKQKTPAAGKNLQTQIRNGLRALAFGGTEDAVRLLFLEEPDPAIIAELNLFNVSELKRVKGGFEVKFFDRFKALELLSRLYEGEKNAKGALPFYQALEEGARAVRTAGGEEGGHD